MSKFLATLPDHLFLFLGNNAIAQTEADGAILLTGKRKDARLWGQAAPGLQKFAAAAGMDLRISLK